MRNFVVPVAASIIQTLTTRNVRPLGPMGAPTIHEIGIAKKRVMGRSRYCPQDMKAKINKVKMTRSSGDVFADLGLARPEERLAKAGLALEIERIIRKRGLTQAEAGKILGIDQPKVSALRRGRLGGFSVERLIRFLNCRPTLGAR